MLDKIRASYLDRRAVVYLRQSTMKQVAEYRESTARQYALRDRALALGWSESRVDVVDSDLGLSGSTAEGRAGYLRLAEDVAHGRVGAIVVLEVSRLSRKEADWHRLLDLCGLADVVIVDEQAVYAPKDDNDRLLLGLKGTMSEAEQNWMRLRLQGGALSKARRGELRLQAPTGYEWDAPSRRLTMTPNQQLQSAVRLVFERFRIEGTANAVARYFARNDIQLAIHDRNTGESRWIAPTNLSILDMLRNPLYTGAYVFGRSEQKRALVNGEIRRRQKEPPDIFVITLSVEAPAPVAQPGAAPAGQAAGTWDEVQLAPPPRTARAAQPGPPTPPNAGPTRAPRRPG